MSEEKQTELARKEAESKFIGKHFLIIGDHPHAGKVAECIAFERVAFGEIRPRMRSDDGDEFFVMKPDNWQMLKNGNQWKQLHLLLIKPTETSND